MRTDLYAEENCLSVQLKHVSEQADCNYDDICHFLDRRTRNCVENLIFYDRLLFEWTDEWKQ